MTTRHTTNNGVTALSEPSFAADWNSPEDRIYDGLRPKPSDELLILTGLFWGLAALLCLAWLWGWV